MERRIDNDLKEATVLLISALHGLGPSEMASQKDIEHFYLRVWEARQEFNFHDSCAIANPSQDITEPGSSVDDVINFFPWMHINCIPRRDLRRTVECLIHIAASWKMDDENYKFALSFPDLVKTENSFHDNLEILQQHDFVRSHMPKYEVRRLLRLYLRFTNYVPCGNNESYRHYIDQERQRLKKLYLEERDHFVRMDVSPVQFLVYLECKLNYVIQDPVVEIAKLWTYFGPFDLGEISDGPHIMWENLDDHDLLMRKTMDEHSISEEAWDAVEKVADGFGTKVFYSTHNSNYFTWKQLHDAGKTLASIFVQKVGSFGWKLVRKPTRRINMDLREARGLLICALRRLPSKIVSRKDFDDFHLLVMEARQEFKFHNNYAIVNARWDIIELCSFVDDVIQIIPWEHIHCIPERAVRQRVEMLMRLVTAWKKKDLFYEFALSSPALVKKEDSFSDNLKMLQQHEFVRNSHISEYELQYLLQEYLDFIKGVPCDNSESYRHYIEQERQKLKKFYLEERETFVRMVYNPVQFLVYLERKLNYVIQDPVVEIAKIWTYFGPFGLGEILDGPHLLREMSDGQDLLMQKMMDES